MKKTLLATILIIILALSLTTGALAQSYSFAVDRQVVNVYWNDDGSLGLDYTFDFSNDDFASPIEYVDVGLPNNNFDYGSISANVNGTPVSISSDYQGSGFGIAVELGSQAIQPGQKGQVFVSIGHITQVLYPDSESSDYASAVFMPSYFGSQYAHGNTDMTVVFHLPPGVEPDQPKYHLPQGWPGPSEPVAGFDADGRITYTWRSSDANAYSRYTFGASFPRTYVPASAIYTPSLWETLGIDPEDLVGFAFCSMFALFFFGAPVLGVVSERKRKMKYLPPKISIEGHGVKRGLTAVEAAILMEQPLDKVMTMILFGLVKKNAAEVVTRDPLRIKALEPLPEDLRTYEKSFLDAFTLSNNNAATRRKALEELTVSLIRSVQDKMKGFSRKETIEYYKSINERAWAQIEAAGTPEVKSQMYADALEWTMLDKEYDDRTRRTFTGPIFVPVWWGHYDPVYRSRGMSGGVSLPSSSGGGGTGSVPGSAFAASVVTGVQNFSSKVIGDLTGFTSKVTNVTNPPPKPSSSSYRGGGRSGGGCACACACAGCACACAGGGR
ncbi:MAG: hypothetical protein AB1846_00180 [Chloroflexota bacterium]